MWMEVENQKLIQEDFRIEINNGDYPNPNPDGMDYGNDGWRVTEKRRLIARGSVQSEWMWPAPVEPDAFQQYFSRLHFMPSACTWSC